MPAPEEAARGQPALEQHFHPMQGGPCMSVDRETMPEEGRRVELVDGCLVVSPYAGRAHNDSESETLKWPHLGP